MEPMKNLCGLIPESLHKRLMEGKSPEMTNSEYLTKILTTYLDQPATAKQEQRTLAVQISDDMFQRLLDRGIDLEQYQLWAEHRPKGDGYAETMEELAAYWSELQNSTQPEDLPMKGMNL